MKIWIAPYQLKPKQNLNRGSSGVRNGFLIKVQSKEYEAGYADVHPWEMLGDASLEEQRKHLQNRQWTPLLRRSIFFAHLDGIARREKRRLLDHRLKLKSHYICADLQELAEERLVELKELGFSTIKVKLGKDLSSEVDFFKQLSDEMQKNFRWRLDFNGRDGIFFLKSVSRDFYHRIDFLEDPEPFSEQIWKKIEYDFFVRCAQDMGEFSPLRRFTQVIKPARQNQLARLQDIITNSMDHPVGQCFAALQAQESILRFSRQPRDYGLRTTHLFTSDEWSEQIHSETPYFSVPQGYGIGFDELLAQQRWVRV